MTNIFYFKNWDELNFKERHLVFQFEAESHETQAPNKVGATNRLSPKEIAIQDLANDPNAYFNKHADHIEETIRQMASGEVAQKHITFANERIGNLKAQYQERMQGVQNAEVLRVQIHDSTQQLIEKAKLRIEVGKRIKESPALKQIYQFIEDDFDGLSPERLIIKIDDIFNQEKDPDTALKRVYGEIIRESLLRLGSDKPADPNQLVNNENTFGREQMEQILEHMDIQMDSLNFSIDQVAKLNSINQVYNGSEGMTYIEMGILDAQGNVQKAGLDRLLDYNKYEDRARRMSEDMPGRVRRIRNGFSRRTPLLQALQARAKEKYKEEGHLPIITIAGHEFDLNEITQEHEDAFQRFSRLYDDSPALENLNEAEKQSELPETLKGLLAYRFDENRGMDGRLQHELPKEIKARLVGLGLKEISINRINRGRIREIEFKYKGEKVDLSIGKHGWGDDYQPYLHIFNKNQKIESRAINVNNITKELVALHKYKIDNQANIDTIDQRFFNEEGPNQLGYHNSLSQMTLLEAKENYLGSLKPPSESDLRPISKERVEKFERILPLILANADQLGINENMNLLQALMKVYQSPNHEELLNVDYSKALDELRSPNSHHYRGIEPQYSYRAQEREGLSEGSRVNKDAEYLSRKKELANMKIGDSIEIEFEGERYSFKLIDSFYDYAYRFQLEGSESQSDDFDINNLDLIKSSPKEQLKYLLGTDSRRRGRELDQLLNEDFDSQDIPKRISMDRYFAKNELLTHPYFKNLPLTIEQYELIKNLNQTNKTKISLNSDKYGNIMNLQVKWTDGDKDRYTLKSNRGNYWRMNMLEHQSGRIQYPFYDVKTIKAYDEIEALKERS